MQTPSLPAAPLEPAASSPGASPGQGQLKGDPPRWWLETQGGAPQRGVCGLSAVWPGGSRCPSLQCAQL